VAKSRPKERASAAPYRAVFKAGDRVRLRFPEAPDLVDAVVLRTRDDEDTGERFYDVQEAAHTDNQLRWVPRSALKQHNLTDDEMDAARQVRNLKLQLSRAREAETRRDERDRLKVAEDLRLSRRGPQPEQGKEMFQLSDEEVARYREERAATERVFRTDVLRKRKEEVKAAQQQLAMPASGVSNLGSVASVGSPLGRGLELALGDGSLGEGSAGYDMSDSDSSSSEGDDDDGVGGPSAMKGPPMSEEDELALMEAKERIRQQKAERIAQREADRCAPSSRDHMARMLCGENEVCFRCTVSLL